MHNSSTQRVVALVDMDCFYCQVEARLDPSLKGKPVAVVQYNQWKGGGIIAVNYEARERGVTRHMRGHEAKQKCPDIVLARVPTIRGKADLSNYRDAGDEVAKVFSEFSDCVQRASIDEAYLDLTKAVQDYIKNHSGEIKPEDLPNTFVVGFGEPKGNNEDERKKGLCEWLELVERQKTVESPEYQLAVGGIIVEKMRLEILNRTGFHCSAGIAHNKILAKLTAGLHKPKKQTILPQDSIPELYANLPIYKVRNLGGKLGKLVAEKLSIKFMSELYKFSLQELTTKFDEKTGSWLYNIARGIDLDPVTSRLKPESIGCCKNFTGNQMLTKRSLVEHWMKELATEISERLMKDQERNKRRAKLMTVSFTQETPMSKCGPINSYEVSRLVQDAMDLLKKFNNAPPNEDVWSPPIKYLGLSASKFTEELASIEKYLKTCKNSETPEKPSIERMINEETFIKKKPKTPTVDKFFKNIENNSLVVESKMSDSEPGTSKTSNPEPSTSKSQTKSSFFLDFMNRRKEQISKKQTENSREEETEEDEDGEMFISLTEVFPDIKEAEADVVEILPEPLQKKFRERLSSNGMSLDLSDKNEENQKTEICCDCGKEIPVGEMMEHSDYHAALKLYSEINKTNSVNGAILIKSKPKEAEVSSKRKKKGAVTPSKKMKSITSFFNIVPK